ncbi:hypothetical protein Tco_0102973 [Tanacetum coccineum]
MLGCNGLVLELSTDLDQKYETNSNEHGVGPEVVGVLVFSILLHKAGELDIGEHREESREIVYTEKIELYMKKKKMQANV